MIRLGSALFVVGVLCTVVALAPLVVSSFEPSSLWWFLSMLTGVGMALILAGLWRNARRRRLAVQSALAAPPGGGA